MSLPSFTFEVGFAAKPLDTVVTFTNLAADLETLAISRGRATEEEIAQTGTATGTLLDDSRKYDPNNAAGPYYPNVQPRKPVRVLATLDATTYPQFYGWVELQNGWIRNEQDAAAASAVVPCTDGFDILNGGRLVDPGTDRVTYGHTFISELTGARIGEALDHSGDGHVLDPHWPTAWRALDTGHELMQAYTADATVSPLSAIRDAETTEPGFFFIDGRGYATFHDRQHRSTAVSRATFCDTANFSAGRVLFESVTTRRTLLVNDVRATRAGGTEQDAWDTTSISQFMREPKDYATQHTDDAHALAYAQWLLSLKKDSYETLESITLRPGTDSPTWVQVLSRELNDRITVVRTPPGGGAAVTTDYFIDQLTINWGPGPEASCTWRLSPAAPTNAWLAGVAGSSEAGTTTKAGY